VAGLRNQKLQWRVARVVDTRAETASARTIRLSVPGWGGHSAGQHIDLKLTAADGYSAQRSYSLARPTDGDRIELTVQEISDGEVSPYLMGVRPGEEIEVRGPIGGWFVWEPSEEPLIMLVAGGSGVVPLMAMLRRRTMKGTTGFRFVYSVRSPADVYYRSELAQLARDCDWLDVAILYTRASGSETARPPGRIRSSELVTPGWTADDCQRVYVCGPTGFVEFVTSSLINQGYSPSAIRTERFGPSG
jgi:ferredoxin-NADP reductase